MSVHKMELFNLILFWLFFNSLSSFYGNVFAFR